MYADERLESLILLFLEELKLRNKSPNTTKSYFRELYRFLEFYDNKPIDEITTRTITSYRQWLSGKNLKQITINHHLSTLKSFFGWCRKCDIVTIAPEKIELAKLDTRTIDILTPEEIKKVFKVTTNKRDKAILHTLYSSGVRVSELINIQREELDLINGTFKTKGKGGKHRLCFMSPDSIEVIKIYLRSRKDQQPWLFVCQHKKKKPLTRFAIQNILTKISSEAKLTKRLHPHMLRHTFATQLLSNGADLRSIQEMLGHKSITTTQIYTHITNDMLKETHKKFFTLKTDN